MTNYFKEPPLPKLKKLEPKFKLRQIVWVIDRWEGIFKAQIINRRPLIETSYNIGFKRPKHELHYTEYVVKRDKITYDYFTDHQIFKYKDKKKAIKVWEKRYLKEHQDNIANGQSIINKINK